MDISRVTTYLGKINRAKGDRRGQEGCMGDRCRLSSQTLFSVFANRRGLSQKISHLFTNIFCGLTAGKTA